MRFTFVKINKTNVEYKCITTKVVTGDSIWPTKAWLEASFGGIPAYLDLEIRGSDENVPQSKLAEAL